MDQIKVETVLKYLKKLKADIINQYTVAFTEICCEVYGNNNYSREDEKELIKIIIQLESLDIINRVDRKVDYKNALYYLTHKGLKIVNS